MDYFINILKTDQEFFIQLGLVIFLLAILLAALHFLIGQKRWYGFGKIIGFILGYFIARAPGAILGLIFGHAFDLFVQPKRVSAKRVRQKSVSGTVTFFHYDTLFAILGNLAQASGNITTTQLNQFHLLAGQLQLNADEQRKAWEWFQYGQHKDFSLRQALFAFNQSIGHDQQQANILMRQVINFAEKVQPINLEQYAILCNVAYALHSSTENFAHLAPKQQESAKQKDSTKTDAGAVNNPYQLLGLESTASNKEIKWAYRKLMGRYHPDKLISKDLPEDLIQLATQRTQEIKAAYEKISQARGI